MYRIGGRLRNPLVRADGADVGIPPFGCWDSNPLPWIRGGDIVRWAV